MRDLITTLLEILGLTLISIAAGMVALPLGIAVGGASLVGVGYLLGREG